MQCRLVYLDSLDIIKNSLGPTTDPHEQAHNHFGHWPLVTADVLLRYFASAAPIDTPPPWKKCLTSLALLLLDLQHSRRLLQFSLRGLEQELSEELENEGCDRWDPEEFPDWLLIQVCILHEAQCVTADTRSFYFTGSRKLSHLLISGESCDGDHVTTVR